MTFRGHHRIGGFLLKKLLINTSPTKIIILVVTASGCISTGCYLLSNDRCSRNIACPHGRCPNGANCSKGQHVTRSRETCQFVFAYRLRCPLQQHYVTDYVT